VTPPRRHDHDRGFDGVLAHVSHKRRKRRFQKRRRSRRSMLITLALVIVGIVLAGMTAVAIAGAIVVDNTLSGVSLDTLTADPPGANTRIFDRDGNLLAILPSTENRTPVTTAQQAPILRQATVAIEDKRFYEHDGVDFQGVLRAALDNLEAGHVVQGGSTLEQQLVRNLYLDDSQTWKRKVREAYLAYQLDKRWTKEQILTEYLNDVPYGAITYGCEAAALQYFSKHCSDLSLWQAATLAGIPQDPLLYNPVENPRVTRDRRNQVLDAMLEQGMITQEQHDKAERHKIRVQPSDYLSQTKQGYFVSWVRSLLQQDPSIGRKGLKGGLDVTTTLDSKLQKAAHRALSSELSYSGAPAGALVAIDPRTGEVLAMDASTNYAKSKYNLAVQGTRQAGSTFKTYALTAALADDHIDPYTTQFMSGTFHYVLSSPVVDPTTDIWDVETHAPRNGGMDLHDAIVASDNTVFARLSVDIGYKQIQDMAYRLGIPRQPPLPDAYSIVLGTGDVSPLDMTHAYSTLADQGVRHELVALRQVKSISTGGTIEKYTKQPGHRVIPDGVAYEVSKMLQDNAMYGTGAASQSYLSGRIVGGKTGTTTDNVDAWFCGYSPTLTACVWVGYPQGSIPMGSEVWGGSIPVGVWARFMSSAFQSEPGKFPNVPWPIPKHPATYAPFTSQFPIGSVCSPVDSTAGGSSQSGAPPCPPASSDTTPQTNNGGGGGSNGGGNGGGGGSSGGGGGSTGPPTT
jgi:penicillin-binding protein 1A